MAEQVHTKEQRAAEIAAARDAMMRQIKETQKRALVQQDQLKVLLRCTCQGSWLLQERHE